MPATSCSIPGTYIGNFTVVFSLIGANSSVTFSFGGAGVLQKIAPGQGIPVIIFRAALDAGIILKGTPRIMNNATGVTTIEFDLHNVTAGGITPTTQVIDCLVI